MNWTETEKGRTWECKRYRIKRFDINNHYDSDWSWRKVVFEYKFFPFEGCQISDFVPTHYGRCLTNPTDTLEQAKAACEEHAEKLHKELDDMLYPDKCPHCEGHRTFFAGVRSPTKGLPGKAVYGCRHCGKWFEKDIEEKDGHLKVVRDVRPTESEDA